MAAKPYLTSNDLIASVKRKISFPTSQNTFTSDDILAFANDEMAISQVPSVLEFHEEYFVFVEEVPFVMGQSYYPIPTRALGMKLRDLKYKDSNNNLFDMARIAPEDKAFFQRNIGTSETLSKYYVEGNNVVMLPYLVTTDAISLMFYYFLRPNQLVANERAATITSFNENITVINSAITPGDSINIGNQFFTSTNGIDISLSELGYPTIINTVGPHGLTTGESVTIANNTTGAPLINGTYIATVTSPTQFSIPITTSANGTDGVVYLPGQQFLIGSNDIQTATNLAYSINFSGLAVATNGTPATSLITLAFNTIPASQSVETSNTNAFIIPQDVQLIQFNQVPTTYTDPNTFVTENLYTVGSTIDFLQTNPGHRTYALDVPIQAISGTEVTFPVADVPTYMIVGDYMCLSNECIIPQIPPDLHNALAQRVCTMILTSIGDMQGAQATAAKVQEMEKHQITLLDNRVESSPLKVNHLKSIARFQGMGSRRRRL